MPEEVAAGVELLEVADQVGPSNSPAQVHGQQRRRDAAHQAAAVAHRVGADLARPGRDWRAVDDQRPQMSGLAAASTSVAQPPWQLPNTTGLGASGWRRDLAQELASARITSARVWPGSGCWRKTTK